MNIQELDAYNLDDAVKFNDRLNPKLWDSNEHLKPEVRDRLLTIAEDFREFLGVKDLDLRDITLSGSNAAYTYTPNSDIDLHLVVNMPDSEVYRELFDAKKFQYNEQHNIKIGGYDVELYVQDADAPHISQGIYSVLNNDWVQVPRRVRADVDDLSTKNKFETVGHRIEQAVASGDLDCMNLLAEKIKKMRQTGLEAHGEFGPENLAFKMLRSQGKIKELYDARNLAKDQVLSLKEKAPVTPVKYGFKTPALPKAGPTLTVAEDVAPAPTDEEILKDFIDFCFKELKLKKMPTIKLRRDPQWSVRNRTFGRYINDQHLLEVAFGQRHIMDVLRTVAHELTHKHQHEREAVPTDAGETGSPYENEANARAGILMRDYGRLHPELFDAGQAQDLHADEVKESVNNYLWHGSREQHNILTPQQANDTGGAEGSNKNAVYATPSAKFAIAMGLTTPGSDTAMFPNDSQMVLFSGNIRKGQMVYLHKVPKDLFIKHNGREWYSKPGVKEVKPIEVVAVPVDKYLNLIRPATPKDLELQKKYKKQGVAEDASGYIPTKKQAKDPRWSMALTQDIRPGQLGKEANKLKLKTNRQGVPQIANPNGLFEKLALELSQFKKTKVAESIQQLDEVRMAHSNLMQWAKSPEAQGIRAGFEAELIFRDATNNGDSDYEMEPDYDMDERCHSLGQVVDFFENGDYGISSQQADRLREQLDEAYYEWNDEQMYKDFKDEAEDLIRKVFVDEDDWDLDNEIQKQLVMQDVSDDELTAIIQAGERAPKFTSSKEQILYAEANPLYDKYLDAQKEAEGLLDDLVADEVSKQGAIWDAALEDFRDSYSLDDDSGFFDDTGNRYMSDVANNYDLEWPYMTGGGGNEGSRDWESIGDSLHDTIDMPVKVSSGYHNATRKEGLWIVEPDTSLEPDDSEDFGLEIVSPPMPLLTALEKLQEVCDWANDSTEGNAYTNGSTGLHMGVSVPFKGGDVDYLKLILFLGDEYVLKSFGREANTYCKSAMSKFKENIKGGRADPMGVIKLMQNGLLELAHREIQKGVGDGKYTSAHIQKGYIEFRSPGGDWLAEESADPEKLQNTMLRFARAMSLAANPGEERREYAKKLYKLVAPEGDSQLALFSQFASGELTAEQLKKMWAEKTIGTEKKMNQRWALYQFDKIADDWTPVPGQSYNGYSEDEVKNKIWAKYGREALDSGEYKLVNMSEDQQWEVYDVNTDKTLEIVAGKNKGEVADKVYDKYADQKIGFNVRPYEDPANMTPRAKLAKRITTKKPEPKQVANQATNERGVPYWEVYEIESKHVVHTFLSDTAADAKVDGSNWLTSIGAEQPELFDVRPKMSDESTDKQATLQNTERGEWEFYRTETGNVIDRVNDASRMQANAVRADIVRRYGHPDASVGMRRVDQQSAEPGDMSAFERNSERIEAIRAQQRPAQDATQRTGSWAIYDVTLGREISRMNDTPWQQASDRADELERSTGHNMSVRGLSENLSETLIALKSSPWIIMESVGPVEIRKSRMFDQTVAEKADQLPNLSAKIQEFLTFKSANPGQPWGKDTPFIAAGPLARALPKLRHVHLTRDLSLFYTIGGRDPIMIRLYGVFNHKESGTGTPGNINRQKSLAKQLDNQFEAAMAENFADGKGPGRPGDSQRHGIPNGATMAELEKASHSAGRKGQLARWQLNMRRGHKK